MRGHQAQGVALSRLSWAAKVSSIVVVTGLLGACGGGEDTSASLPKFRPYDTDATNIFYVVGAPNGLPGVATDVREMTRLLGDTNNGLGWTVRTNGNATKAQILAELRNISASVGENGTIGLYVSGHGADDGKYMTASGMLGFGEVATAIQDGRATPLKRLLTFNDSCFSGHWVDGNGALPGDEEFDWNSVADGPAGYETLEDAELDALAEKAASEMSTGFLSVAGTSDGIEQFMTFAASSKSRTSLDMGSSRGGAFTYSLRMQYQDLKASAPEATVGDLATGTTSRTWDLTRHHTPVYKAHPASLLDEKLFPAR